MSSPDVGALSPLTSLPPGSLTPQGLTLNGGMPFVDYCLLGRALGFLRDLSAFAIGDWLIEGERLYGENLVAQAVEETGLSKSTLLNRRRVSAAIPLARRRLDLSWSHHEAVASLDPVEQDQLLAQAVASVWSVEELRGHREGEPASVRASVRSNLVVAARAAVGVAAPRHDGYLIPHPEFAALKDAL